MDVPYTIEEYSLIYNDAYRDIACIKYVETGGMWTKIHKIHILDIAGYNKFSVPGGLLWRSLSLTYQVTVTLRIQRGQHFGMNHRESGREGKKRERDRDRARKTERGRDMEW